MRVPRLASCFGGTSRFFSSITHKTHYDVVVVGGGMVGFGFAAFAGKYSVCYISAALHPMLRNRRILLIEENSRKEYVKGPEHNVRVVALTPMSRSLIEGVGAWDVIMNTRCRAISKMKVLENGTSASLLLKRSNPNDVLGYIVENDLILSSLAESVARAAAESGTKARPGCIDMMHNVVIENLRFPKSFSQSDLPELSIRQRDSDKRTSVKTHLLVGADGFNSSVRKASGIHTIGWKHDQSAIVANLNLGPEYDYTTAWQRFLETGPIAFLPLQPCHRPSGIVSGLTKALRMAISRKNESFMPPTILSVQPGTRTKFPLSFSHCTFYHGPRVALIGDAAHRILPLSGQGVNMGLGDASCLAHTIDRALFEGCDIADPRHLARFTSERQRSVAPMGFFIEGIQALYTPDEVFGGPLTMHGPVTSSRALIRRLSAKCGVSDALLSIRGLGLDFVDACSPVKSNENQFYSSILHDKTAIGVVTAGIQRMARYATLRRYGHNRQFWQRCDRSTMRK
ncbi:unnamed protein product [Mesocestoides corti]|uniref:FAD-binding domain-containing protein n=1 Tax=Mesocestoides corti TaxID=53468 RepID=A0A0R3UK94_MESCO|nr:unnamed protein product [Mesocestoides corti]